MRFKYLLFLLCLSIVSFGAACFGKSNENHGDEETALASTVASVDKTRSLFVEKTIIVKQELKSEDSPIGYWDVDISYPKYSAEKPSGALTIINQSIEALSKRYHCESGGDQTFTAKTNYLSRDILSLSYESMWMCATMPHPDSVSGSLIFDLVDGRQLAYSDFFISAEKKVAFEQFLLQKRTEKAGEQVASCKTSIRILTEGIEFNCADHGYGSDSAIVFKRGELQQFFLQSAPIFL